MNTNTNENGTENIAKAAGIDKQPVIVTEKKGFFDWVETHPMTVLTGVLLVAVAAETAAYCYCNSNKQ